MPTSGFIAFTTDNHTKTSYAQFDAYPSSLGTTVLDWLRTADPDTAQAQARALRVVDGYAEPTDAALETLKDYYTPARDAARPIWYQVLHHIQGRPAAILAAGVIPDDSRYRADSRWVEWGYVVDFDAMAFEVYEGFQKAQHSEGRFADMPPERDSEYFPVRLVKSWPLSGLPDNDAFMAVEGD
jgi:hypothetical protein